MIMRLWRLECHVKFIVVRNFRKYAHRGWVFELGLPLSAHRVRLLAAKNLTTSLWTVAAVLCVQLVKAEVALTIGICAIPFLL
jgi:hypothetical protein